MPYLSILPLCLLSLFGYPDAIASTDCRPDPDGPMVDRQRFATASASDYRLPFETGTRALVWRTTSHYTPGNHGVGLYAVDFGVPIGTPVIAARAGTVVATEARFADGNDQDLQENFVMIQHQDLSVARYIHLKQGGVLVAIGDAVRQGQRIAFSGNSGQTGGSHLHFDVQTCGPNLPPDYNALPCGMTLPVRFNNVGANACGLRAGVAYQARSTSLRPSE